MPEVVGFLKVLATLLKQRPIWKQKDDEMSDELLGL